MLKSILSSTIYSVFNKNIKDIPLSKLHLILYLKDSFHNIILRAWPLGPYPYIKDKKDNDVKPATLKANHICSYLLLIPFFYLAHLNS